MLDLYRFPAATECALSEGGRHGLWHEESYTWIIEPVERYEILEDEAFLQVGRPGVDGIGFGYREGEVGFWAYYPQEGRFEKLAPSLAEFIEGWFGGRITV